jgi:hypothetical protein
MVAHLKKTELGYAILLSNEMVEEMRLSEGSAVQVVPVPEAAEESRPQIRYASAEEALRVHRESEPEHAEAYRELAK